MKFTYKDFVLDSHRPHAQWAAEAARCAADQGKFWAYRSVLFSNQKKWTKGDLKRYAEELELDTKQFNQCVDEEKHKEAVNRDTAEAESLGLPGTPAYVINGQHIDITQYGTVQTFMQKLKEEVTKANGGGQ